MAREGGFQGNHGGSEKSEHVGQSNVKFNKLGHEAAPTFFWGG
jgi:hypothetical protein